MAGKSAPGIPHGQSRKRLQLKSWKRSLGSADEMGDGVDAPYGIYVPRWWC